MDIRKIAEEVAAAYKIDTPALEGGIFSVPQWQILYPLAKQFEKTGSEEDARRYIDQKAKFLTKKRT